MARLPALRLNSKYPVYRCKGKDGSSYERHDFPKKAIHYFTKNTGSLTSLHHRRRESRSSAVIVDLIKVRNGLSEAQADAADVKVLALLERMERASFNLVDPIRACDINGIRAVTIDILLRLKDLEELADPRAIGRYCDEHLAAIRRRLAKAEKARETRRRNKASRESKS